MDYQDLDEEERARRKQESVAFRTRKHTARMFMVSMSIFEIIETLIIIVALFLLSAFITFRVFKADGPVGQIVFQIVSVVIFIGGMILGFFVYKAFAKWIIKKFKLEEKLPDDVLEHYKSKEERKDKLDSMKRQ